MDNGITEGKLPKPALNFPKENPNQGAKARGKSDAVRDGVKVPGWMKASLPDPVSGETARFKFSSRDGDALESRGESGAGACYAGTGASRGGSPIEALEKSETANAADAGEGGAQAAAVAANPAVGEDPEATAVDPKEKRLAELRTWAEGVEKELRLQQQRLLEQLLKEPGRHVQSGDGKFLIIIAGPESVDAESAESCGEAQVPEYWNAENTSDRIVHFATQMAEICGLDPAEFAEKITQAVGLGFDQANAETGPLPGAAGKLNRDTRDLVFSKLSKWLEDRKTAAYNGEDQQKPASTADVTSGTQNNQ